MTLKSMSGTCRRAFNTEVSCKIAWTSWERRREEAQAERDVLLEKLQKTELLLTQSNERAASLQSQTSDIQALQVENAELRKQQKQSTSTGAEIALRIELDRLSRTLTKERKLFELQMSEMRDQVMQQQAPSTFDEIERLRAEKGELERMLSEERARHHRSPRPSKASDMTPFKKTLTLQIPTETGPTPKQKSPENAKPMNLKTPAAVNECKQQ